MIFKLIPYYRPHKKLFFMDLLCALLIAASDLIYPMITRSIIDDVVPNREFNMLIVLSMGLLLLYILRFFMDYFVGYYGHVLGVRMEYQMRKELFTHIETLPQSYFDNTKTGHIMSRIVNDLNEITEMAHHAPEDLFISLVMLVGSFIMLANISLPLTLVVFAVLPFLLIFTIYYNKKMKKVFKKMRVDMADVNAEVEDSISGIRVVKSFTNEEYEKKKFDRGNKKFKNTKITSVKYVGIFQGGVNFFSHILIFMTILVGGYFLYAGKILIGDFVAYIMYVGQLLNPVKKFANFIEQYQRGMASFKRFEEVMAIESDIKDSSNALDIENAKGNVEFCNVGFKYEEGLKVLSSINLSVKSGETVAIVGPSGAGKSTMCSLIPRFYEVTNGKITLDGMDIKDIKLKSLRDNIGIVQQDVFLFAGTVKENILYGKLGATNEEIEAAAKFANAHEFIEKLENGYETYIGERGVKLSGGQKQRISIARMFLKNPKILILDEATSSLDNKSENIIQESIEKLSKNRTTFIIAHRLATIKNAERIVVLTENGVEEEGTHNSLLDKKGVYYSLYNSQFE